MDKDKWNKLTPRRHRRRSNLALYLLILLHESPVLLLAGVFVYIGKWEAVALLCMLYLGLRAIR